MQAAREKSNSLQAELNDVEVSQRLISLNVRGIRLNRQVALGAQTRTEVELQKALEEHMRVEAALQEDVDTEKAKIRKLQIKDASTIGETLEKYKKLQEQNRKLREQIEEKKKGEAAVSPLPGPDKSSRSFLYTKNQSSHKTSRRKKDLKSMAMAMEQQPTITKRPGGQDRFSDSSVATASIRNPYQKASAHAARMGRAFAANMPGRKSSSGTAL